MLFNFKDSFPQGLSFREKDVIPATQYKQYSSYEELKKELSSVENFPIIATVGIHGHHTLVVLGIDENGDAIVFEKGNIGTNYPWTIESLENVFNEHNSGMYEHMKGLSFFSPRKKK
jgi:hypothetical protein